MPDPEQKEPTTVGSTVVAGDAATVVSSHEGEDGMGSRSMTVGRYEEIRRRLIEGRSLREIARALGCARHTVREVRDGLRVSPATLKPAHDPLWIVNRRPRLTTVRRRTLTRGDGVVRIGCSGFLGLYLMALAAAQSAAPAADGLRYDAVALGRQGIGQLRFLNR